MTQMGIVGTNVAIPRLTTLSGKESSRCVRPMRLAQENGFGVFVWNSLSSYRTAETKCIHLPFERQATKSALLDREWR